MSRGDDHRRAPTQTWRYGLPDDVTESSSPSLLLRANLLIFSARLDGAYSRLGRRGWLAKAEDRLRKAGAPLIDGLHLKWPWGVRIGPRKGSRKGKREKADLRTLLVGGLLACGPFQRNEGRTV